MLLSQNCIKGHTADGGYSLIQLKHNIIGGLRYIVIRFQLTTKECSEMLLCV